MSPPAPRINTFSHHVRAKFGEPVGKLPLDLGIPCPNRKQGGCSFCRPASFTPAHLDATDKIAVQLSRGKAHLLKGRFNLFFGYFQQESCTALPTHELLPILAQVLTEPGCVGLILSTRPDQVQDKLLSQLAKLLATAGKECLFELGMQSGHDRSLARMNRNHTVADVVDAVQRIKAAGPFQTSLHLIFGLPGESEEEMLESLAFACGLEVDALKLHHLQVIRDTPLHQAYQQGEVSLFSREGYQEFLLKALPRIPAQTVIHRLWATAHPQLLVAPKWNVLATHLSSELQEEMASRNLWQGGAS